MKHVLTLLISVFLISNLIAQNTFKVTIVNSTGNRLQGATVTWNNGNASKVSDTSGSVIYDGIPNGAHSFTFTHIGYEELKKEFCFSIKRFE